MADDAHAIQRLHPDDRRALTEGVVAELRAVFEASAKGPALPPPGRPPVALDDIDAKSFERLKGDLLGAVGKAVRDATIDFLPEEDINERIERATDTATKSIDDRLDRFKRDFLDEVRTVVKDEMEKMQTGWFEIFADLKMPLEKGEKRIETREKLADLFAMQTASKQWKSELGKAIRAASIGGVLTTIGGFLAYIFARGGTPH